jgi:hypothetical protein
MLGPSPSIKKSFTKNPTASVANNEKGISLLIVLF